jgi:anti-sigma B factor antagonist
MFWRGEPCASHLTRLRYGCRSKLRRLAAPAQVAAMSDAYPVQWAGGTAIVTLPQHVGEFNASRIHEQLLLVIYRGATELVADMTGTAWCDQVGVAVVARAYRRAAACGTQLRLVVTAKAVRRMLALRGLDRLIPIYPSLDDAVAATMPTAAASVVNQPDGLSADRRVVGTAARAAWRPCSRSRRLCMWGRCGPPSLSW